MKYVHPPAAPLVAQIRLALGDLIGMVGEGVVDAAAVDVQEVRHGHRPLLYGRFFCRLRQAEHQAPRRGRTRYYDMPAGVPHAPGGVPFQSLVLKFGLREPEDEVVFIPLVCVLLHALPNAYRKVLGIVIVENVVGVSGPQVVQLVDARTSSEYQFR